MSSVLVFCRALIMLGCLLAIPLTAMFYGELPVAVRNTVSRARVFLAQRLADAAPVPPSEVDADRELPTITVSDPNDAGPADSPLGEQAATPLRLPVSKTHPHARQLETPRPDAPAVVPAVHFEDARPETRPVSTAAMQAERLRTMGAADYALEAWGDSGTLYRFRCKMPMGGNAQVCRHFEAVDRVPDEAVKRVILAVETWQLGRR